MNSGSLLRTALILVKVGHLVHPADQLHIILIVLRVLGLPLVDSSSDTLHLVLKFDSATQNQIFAVSLRCRRI